MRGEEEGGRGREGEGRWVICSNCRGEDTEGRGRHGREGEGEHDGVKVTLKVTLAGNPSYFLSREYIFFPAWYSFSYYFFVSFFCVALSLFLNWFFLSLPSQAPLQSRLSLSIYLYIYLSISLPIYRSILELSEYLTLNLLRMKFWSLRTKILKLLKEILQY